MVCPMDSSVIPKITAVNMPFSRVDISHDGEKTMVEKTASGIVQIEAVAPKCTQYDYILDYCTFKNKTQQRENTNK